MFHYITLLCFTKHSEKATLFQENGLNQKIKFGAYLHTFYSQPKSNMKKCYKIQRWYKILSELSSWNSSSFGRENRIFHWHQLYHVHFWEHITWTRRSTNVEQRGNSATNFKAQRHKTLDSVTSLLQQVFFNSSSHNGSSFLWKYIYFTVSHNLVPDDSWNLLSSTYHKYMSSHRDHVFLLLLYPP